MENKLATAVIDVLDAKERIVYLLYCRLPDTFHGQPLLDIFKYNGESHLVLEPRTSVLFCKFSIILSSFQS